MYRRLLQCVTMISALSSAEAFAQPATVKTDDVLRSEPSPTASSVASVTANAKLGVTDRKGFWAKVDFGGTTGWLKLSSLNLDQGGGAPSGSAISGLASGRTGSGNIVSASGTRGLSAEDLKAAKPDMAAVAQVKKLAVPADEATRYAQSGGLLTRKVAYISDSGEPQK